MTGVNEFEKENIILLLDYKVQERLLINVRKNGKFEELNSPPKFSSLGSAVHNLTKNEWSDYLDRINWKKKNTPAQHDTIDFYDTGLINIKLWTENKEKNNKISEHYYDPILHDEIESHKKN